MKKLFENATANDATKANAFEITNEAGNAPLVFHFFGDDFDTCTLTVFWSLNGLDNGIAIAALTKTAAAIVELAGPLPNGITMWATLSSVGASTDVSLYVAGQGIETP